MKIGANLDPTAMADTASRTSRAATAPVAGTRAASGEQVAVSAAGAQMAAGSGNDFDSAKVDAIRQAIRDGRYKINAGAIADRLISDAAALLAPRA